MNFGPTIGKVPLASPYDNIHDEECLGKFVLKMGRTMDASGIILHPFFESLLKFRTWQKSGSRDSHIPGFERGVLAYLMFFIDFISLNWI